MGEVYKLRTLQFGKQTVWGTPVNATAIYRIFTDGSVNFNPNVIVLDELGYMGAGGEVVDGVPEVTGEITATATYEHLLFPLCGLFGAPTPQGASAPYTWNFDAPLKSSVNPQLYTAEFGTPGMSYRLRNTVISNLTLSGEAGEPVESKFEMQASKLTPQALTSALSLPVVTPLSMTQASLFMDDWSGTIGTTQIQKALAKFELSVETGRHLKVFDGNEAAGWGDEEWEVKLALTLETTTEVKALFDSMTSSVLKKLIRLKFTKGTSELSIDFAGASVGEVEFPSDRDGNAVIDLEFTAVYNPVLANYLKIVLKNSINALP